MLLLAGGGGRGFFFGRERKGAFRPPVTLCSQLVD